MMKKAFLPLIILFISFKSYSQISFAKGYFIDNTGKKIDCYIKNRDWKNNPTTFEYKLLEDSERKEANINSVQEFAIYDILKYERHTVGIDRSSSIFNYMDTNDSPVLKNELLFLKVLIEGNASLFSYIEGNLKRYFYKTASSKVEQLIYKKFKTQKGNIGANTTFKQQLWNDLKCSDISLRAVQNIDYRKNELMRFFVKYNECTDSVFVNFEKKQKKDFFNFTARVQLHSSSLSIKNSNTSARNTDFGSQTGVKFGVEMEFVLPFNKNKWAIILEPTYQQFKSEREITDIPTPTVPLDDRASVKYSSVELPIGLRHYMFLNDKSKLFINSSFVVDFDSNSKIDFERLQDLEIVSNNNLTFGLGYKHEDKYGVELRYSTTRDLLSTQSAWSSEFKSVSIIFGYTLF